MKKLFPDEKGQKRSFKEFLDKKGFFIVLLLCIAIVASTAVYVTMRGATSPKSNYDTQNIVPDDLGKNSGANTGGDLNAQAPSGISASAADQKVAVNDPAKITSNDSKVNASASKNSGIGSAANTTKSSSAKAPVKSSTPAKATNASAARLSFISPVIGDVSFEYAKDKLVYSKTLEEWRTHEGLDLAADRGTPVKAVADGVVSEIKNDPRFGCGVIIDHKNGVKSVYSNLASDEMVTVNQIVKQGEIIGSVGNTAVFESAEQSHLHFEVLKDNLNVDPSAYLPKKTESKN